MGKCLENYSACPYFNAARIEGHLATHLARITILGVVVTIGNALELAAREEGRGRRGVREEGGGAREGWRGERANGLV